VTSETTRPSLLTRLRDPADALAWNEFDARYRDLILRHCRRRGLQTADAEDVRQLVMLSLSRALRSFRYDPALGRFRDYLGRVVHNAIQRSLERPARAGALLDTDALSLLATPDSPLDEHWETDWMHHHLRLAMIEVRKSSEPETMTVFERLVAGESVPAVASASGKSQEAVQKILQRVRERLRDQIGRQISEEELPLS